MSELSTCCDAQRWMETDLCSDCKEHADFYDEYAELCSTCSDGDDIATGYLWDSLLACPDCEKGREIQHRYDVQELENNEHNCRKLRKKIKAYKSQQGE